MARGRHGSVQNGPGVPWECLKWPAAALGEFETAQGRFWNVLNSSEAHREHPKWPGSASGASKVARGASGMS